MMKFLFDRLKTGPIFDWVLILLVFCGAYIAFYLIWNSFKASLLRWGFSQPLVVILTVTSSLLAVIWAYKIHKKK